MLLANLKNGFIAVTMAILISGIAPVCFAEDAPVYEVDNYPPPFDGQPEPTVADNGDAFPHSPPGSAQTFASPPPSNSYSPQARQEAYVPPPPPRAVSTSERVTRLEQQINNLQQSNPVGKAEELQKEVQALRGQVEELTHQLQISQNQQRIMFADLDKRLANVPSVKAQPSTSESPTANQSIANVSGKPTSIAKGQTNKAATTKTASQNTTVAPAKPTANEQPNMIEEQQIYQTAYDLIKAKKYNDAIGTLQKMLQKYPSGQFAANAHYWLGELYGLVNKNDLSAAEFLKVTTKYPDSPKTSDAYLKLGLIYVGQLKWEDAKTSFKKVIKVYPGTASARLASEQLKQIKQSGH